MAIKESWRKWFRRDNLVIVILTGVLLFIIYLPTEEKEDGNVSGQSSVQTTFGTQNNDVSKQVDSTDSGGKVYEQDFASKLEKQLEETLSEMAGVGKVSVMITLKASEELVVEKDMPVTRSNTNENDSAGGSRVVAQVDSSETTVYRSVGSDSEPYVVKTLAPQVEGVVVVAQGAGKGTVNQDITEMVQALFGVEAHKVKVVKMNSEG